MDAIDQALARLMTCAPAQCPRETDCLKIAQWALEQRRNAFAVPTAPRLWREEEAVTDYEPHWEGPRRVFPDWDAA